jgi:hypothetical protein
MRRLATALVMAAMIWGGLPWAHAATPDEVETSIARAKEYLYSKQVNGNWEAVQTRDPKANDGGNANGTQWGGLTSIVTYALLAAGENPTEPRIVSAVEFLRKAEITGVYALGMRAQVWHFLPKTPENVSAARRDGMLLLQGIQKQGRTIGLFDYRIAPPEKNRIDLSVSQYGVLGLWAVEQTGAIEIPAVVWQQMEKSWINQQESDGGWGYHGKGDDGRKPDMPMTAAGVATLFITQDYNHAMAGLTCRGDFQNPAIDKGMAWIAKRFDEALRGSKYGLYGIERIGVASGYKYFNAIDWYQRGADTLVKSQSPDGHWGGQWGDIPETCFGTLFMARGRAPVVMNKLQYGASAESPGAETRKGQAAKADSSSGDWNQRPRDAANIVRWIGRQAERDLNWQIVNLNGAVEDLSDAPILYIAGSNAPNFTPEQKAKIKTYIENGGMVVANADCGNAAFANAMRKLGGELFPLQEFRELPADHPIYVNAQFLRTKWRTKPNVMAQSNDVRELIVIIPQADPAKQWQTQSDKGKEELFQLMANIFLYSVDKQGLQYKGRTHLVLPMKDVKPDRTIKVARLEYHGNWNPEPGGWRRMQGVMLNDKKVTLTVDTVNPTAWALKSYKIAHLTGTTKFKLDDVAREEIKSFVAAGGTLIVDAAGGSGDFASSADLELRAMFPNDMGKLDATLPADHPIYAIPDDKITEVGYRTFARFRLTGDLRTARLRGIPQGNRTAVIYSPEDLSTGMVGNQIDGVVGYDPATATNLMRNILLYANTAK